MKVIFLDIDGVLNCVTTTIYTPDGWLFVDDYFVENLHCIVQATKAQLILSSSWRLDWEDPDLDLLRQKLTEYNLHLAGHTPTTGDEWRRDLQIQEYLRQHPEIDKYLIIDDEACLFNGNTKNLLLTNPREGLTAAVAELAICELNAEEDI